LLQWGHAGEGVEIAPSPPAEHTTFQLQWCHAGEGVEMTAALAESNKELLASMGPRR